VAACVKEVAGTEIRAVAVYVGGIAGMVVFGTVVLVPCPGMAGAQTFRGTWFGGGICIGKGENGSCCPDGGAA
jgi:hypothetical protein